uniref:Uncharacterized protein n=1 Tax=Ditylum brightwellii TaxID=49249 RepID=A0A7S2ERM8_9STRA|mmetsp:Transcript_4161/g.6380  ORF Transcript_4161/g.6380 Transcript_4161/m.6380 type:complete len:334 (+) Transcript_4161:52-1053(+)
MEVAVHHFAAGVFAALTAKLASSIDDVVWLAAFLTPNLSPKERYANAITYASVCFIQTVLAYLISTGGEAALDKIIVAVVSRGGHNEETGHIISTERVLTLFAGFTLFVYAIKLGIEYYYEEILGEGGDDDDDSGVVGNNGNNKGYSKVQNAILDESSALDEEKGEGGRGLKAAVGGDFTIDDTDVDGDNVIDVNIDSFDDEDGMEGRNCDAIEIASSTGTARGKTFEPLEIEDDDIDASKCFCLSDRSRTLPIVAFLGSLDDLTLFVPMLVGKTFGMIELVIGSTVAGTIIVLICLFITKCEMLSNFLQRIPLAAIVAIFSVFLLIKGFIME